MATEVDPKDIPSPTSINLPRYQPFAEDDEVIGGRSQALPWLLEQTGRESLVLGSAGLLAIGLDLKLDADDRDLIPDTSCLPDFHQWDCFTAEEARNQDGKDRLPLKTGGMSPGCQVYLERRRELSNANEDAFRTVRRISPPKGRQQARLGNTYEFFRCLELFTTFWDDPTQRPELPPSPELTTVEDGTCSDAARQKQFDTEPSQPSTISRTSCGQSMPPEFRQNLLNAFIKLVAYDFGCNVSMARVEPRLHLTSLPGRNQRKSYTPSNCHFVFQSPMTRETARAGVVYGPVAAVSARPTVNFTSPDAETAQSLDLAREVLAALITAQHRNREGKEESRFGHQQWWTTQRRWGGGVGGPIGREIEKIEPVDDTQPGPDMPDGRRGPITKKARKTMPVYDNYRMVRPPASTWDRKAKYETIGKVKGAGYDDIFVISSLFHHVSVLRVRVPARLLEVLDGSPEPDLSKRSWGRVPAWRSPWYDFFDVDQRIAAMRMVWAVVAYQMRKNPSRDENIRG